MPNVAAPTARSRVVATAVTSLAQMAVLLGAATMGILIGRRFGSTAATDGFFTANAIYGVVLFVGQSLRTTAVARLIDSGHPSFARLGEHIRAVGVITVATAVVFGVMALGAGLAVKPGAEATFRTAVLLFIPGAALQLLGGLGAAMLAAFEDWTASALAYSAGAIANVASFWLWTSIFGIDGVPLALVTGGAVATLGMALALRRHGWRREVTAGSRPRAVPLARRMVADAASLVAGQLMLAVSTAFAGQVQTGGATVYAYAMMIILALTTGLISPMSVVFAPVVAREWDRQRATIVPLTLRAYRVGALLLVPALALIVLAGRHPAERLLTRVPAADVDRVFTLVLYLGPSLLAGLAVAIAYLAVFTAGHGTRLAGWTLAVTAAHAVATAVAVAAGGGLTILALVTSVASLGISAVVLATGLGRHGWAVARGAALATAQIVVPGALIWAGASRLLDGTSSFVDGVAAFLAGLAGYAVWLGVTSRRDVTELLALLRR